MPVIRTFVIAVGIAGCASSVFAQPLTKEQVERRFQIRTFGNVLVGAAQHGAALMAMQVQQIDPSIILVERTTARARGFVIEGHGVFFHMEIPNVDPVVAWAVTTRGRDQAAIATLNSLKNQLPFVTDPQARQVMQENIATLERRFGSPAAQQSQVGTMQVSGTAPGAPSAPPPVMVNPSLEYERLVTEQLINAMLDHSHQLGLAADEWLTIAAHGSAGPFVPDTAHDDTVTIMLRIKGGDLTEFRAGRLTREEARARVVVREF